MEQWSHKKALIFGLAFIAVAIIAVTITEFFPINSDNLVVEVVFAVIVGIVCLTVLLWLSWEAIKIPFGLVQEMKQKRKVRSAKSMAYDLIEDDKETAMKKQELAIHTRYYNQTNTAWGSFASYYRENIHLVSNLRSLKICHKCYQLYGLVRLKDDQVVTQKCGCNWSYDDERWHETIGGITYYHHHNKEYEICYCCGLEVISSGSIWSLLYCQDCKARVNKFNEMAGKCIIPYGRYSVMNNVSLSLSVENSKDKKAIGEFVTAANNMNQSIGIIDKYSKTIAEKQVRLLHMAEDAPLIDLLLKTSGLQLNELKKEAFVMMLIALGFGRVIEIVKW